MKLMLGFAIPVLAFMASFGGAVTAVSIKNVSEERVLHLMCLAGGIMLSLTYTELLPLARGVLKSEVILVALFSAGLLISVLIDRELLTKGRSVPSVGIIAAAAIALHNIPEGMAAFIIGSDSPELRISYAAAVVLHELPLGASAAAEIYRSTNDKRGTLRMALIAAMAQPVGAVTACFILKDCLTEQILGGVYSFMAGIVAYTALFELLPEGMKLEKNKSVIWISAGILILPLMSIIR